MEYNFVLCSHVVSGAFKNNVTDKYVTELDDFAIKSYSIISKENVDRKDVRPQL